MNRKPKLGEIVFWPNYDTFGVRINPEFWAKKAKKDFGAVKAEMLLGKIPLLLLGSLMALKFPFAPKLDPGPKVKHSNIYFLVHPADVFSIGSAENLAIFCRCALPFSGGNDRKFLESIRDEAKALMQAEGCLPELAKFFAEAIPRK